MQSLFQIIGHRGARGLYPENTVQGFLEALKLGVDGLEMDVVVSEDRQLVVSHEAWMNPEFCLTSEGKNIGEEAQKKYNLYKMPYAAIAAFDCGSKQNREFPQQRTFPAHKPLLPEVILQTEGLIRKNGWPARYHIEIKSDGDNVFNPAPKEFVALFLDELERYDIHDRLVIKSFDVRILRELRAKKPSLKIALLIENNESLDENLSRLGFVPWMLCPDHVLVSATLVRQAHKQGMRVMPWTVNDLSDFQRMAEAGVDGLITDYPDRALEWRKKQNL